MPKTGLDLKHVRCKELCDGVWLCGWLFETRKSGEATVLALADLYNAFEEREKKSADEQDVNK